MLGDMLFLKEELQKIGMEDELDDEEEIDDESSAKKDNDMQPRRKHGKIYRDPSPPPGHRIHIGKKWYTLTVCDS